MQIKSFVYLLSAVSVVAAQNTAAILSHLAALQTSVTTLDNAINAFPDSGGSLTQALGIHSDALNAQSAADATTNSTHGVPAPVSESDGQSLVSAIQILLPVIEDALSGVVEKKPAFDALPLGGVSGLVKQDLGLLSASTSALETALIALSPTDLAGEAADLKSEVDAAFATAIAAYA